MARGRILLLMTLAGLLGACRPQLPAAVDYPYYAYRNALSLELLRVERTDTATVLSLRGYYRPGWWITIDSLSFLYADGRRCALHGAEGIVPGTRKYIREAETPGEGWVAFRLFFDPLPTQAVRCDFLEGESTDAFQMLGIDLTGRPVQIAAGADGNPAEDRLPAASREPGTTTIRIHLPVEGPWTETISGDILVEGRRPGVVRQLPVFFDRDGVAEVRFKQTRTSAARISLGIGTSQVSCWTKPGETADIYWVPNSRFLTIQRLDLQEAEVPHIRYEGAYAAVNAQYGQFPAYRLDLSAPDLFRGVRTGAEFSARVERRYAALRARLDADTALTPLQRDLSEVLLKGDVLRAMCTAEDILRLQYALEHGTDAGYSPVVLTDTDFAWLSALDLSDSRLLFCDATEYLTDPRIRRLTDSK